MRLMLDLFAGLGGASAAMRGREGWEVVTVDVEPGLNPDVVADVRSWSWTGPRPTLVWASPPCTEFSRESMPWTRTGKAPDLTLVKAALRVISEASPTFWILENVRGAVRFLRPLLGPPRQACGPFFLWGRFPPFRCRVPFFKERLSGDQRARRAMVPPQVSRALAVAVEGQLAFDVCLAQGGVDDA